MLSGTSKRLRSNQRINVQTFEGVDTISVFLRKGYVCNMIKCDDCKSLAGKESLYSLINYIGDTQLYALCDECKYCRMAFSVFAIPPGSLAIIEHDQKFKVTKHKGFETVSQEVSHPTQNQ